MVVRLIPYRRRGALTFMASTVRDAALYMPYFHAFGEERCFNDIVYEIIVSEIRVFPPDLSFQFTKAASI